MTLDGALLVTEDEDLPGGTGRNSLQRHSNRMFKYSWTEEEEEEGLN